MFLSAALHIWCTDLADKCAKFVWLDNSLVIRHVYKPKRVHCSREGHINIQQRLFFGSHVSQLWLIGPSDQTFGRFYSFARTALLVLRLAVSSLSRSATKKYRWPRAHIKIVSSEFWTKNRHWIMDIEDVMEFFILWCCSWCSGSITGCELGSYFQMCMHGKW